MKYLLTGILFFLFSWIINGQNNADLLLINGKIYSLDGKNSVYQAIAIKDGIIIDLGNDNYILKKYKSSNVINLNKKTVLPGFTDAHGHLIWYGTNLNEVDLLGASSIKEIQKRILIKLSDAKKGQWIMGNLWDQNLWENKGWPDHLPLDEIAPDNPVYLTRIDGHAVWVNKKAMELAGITKETVAPSGGEIIKDQKGNPTGVFIDNAIGLLYSALPKTNDEDIEKAIILAQDKLAEFGITEVHSMGISLKEFEILKKLADSGKLKIRVRGYADGSSDMWDYLMKNGKVVNYGNNFLSILGIKLFIDGAMGSRGAVFFEPYNDDPKNSGLQVTDEEEIYQITKTALINELQVCTHAIGDKGNNIVINAYEKALKEVPPTDHRLRIEHVQVINPDDMKRMADLKIIPSMQMKHATSDMYWAEARVGPERVKYSYAYKSLLDKCKMVAGGSDFPVEIPDVLEGIYAAVTRQNKDGHPSSAEDMKNLVNKGIFVLSEKGITNKKAFENGWYPEQRVSVADAVNMFTKWAAYAAFEENNKGTIEKGKWADLVVIEKDIFKVRPKDIFRIKVNYTITSGRIVYENVNK